MLIILGLTFGTLHAQLPVDSTVNLIKDIYRKTYSEEKAYQWLTTLCKDIGHRLSGSPQAAQAVDWAKKTLDTFGLDAVWLQPAMVTHWERGDNEIVKMISKEMGTVTLKALALGNSVGTGPDGVRAEIIEVQSLDQLRAMPNESVAGKIVFFNRPMDLGLTNTFAAYGGAADQRFSGPRLAAEKGALAAVIRSLSTAKDDFPHTGATFYSDTTRNIPAVAVSTNDADRLTKAIHAGKTEMYIRTTCKMDVDVPSFNVIGEIKGSDHADEYIIVGGHLDSWDVGEGANDDGAGIVQSMEVLYRLAKMGYKPHHTIRCVMFMNEENGLKGSKEYARQAALKNEKHIAAIETDGGAGAAQSFGCAPGALASIDSCLAYLHPYVTTFLDPYDLELSAGGGGADIGSLKPNACLLIGLRPESARYFDYHHSGRDV
ncbi:MAG TPA: M20/M25/M40 family metallo-hydrolase, partial [Saprospiraceae bacterium]|nr:M20/M25/M40 family metallo-hydrolase [Saprospiraceae bacterium]